MSVIRSLTSSRDTEERDREKKNLENDFKKSDLQLNNYVISHHADLTFTMQAYSKISTNLIESKTKLKEIREKLITCQQLLHCKRDELKKLYLESMENKCILELLDQVEIVCQANEKIKKLIKKKQYLTATKLLVKSSTNLKTSLKNVEALKEIKNDLGYCQDEIYDALIEELHKCLFVEPLAIFIDNFQKLNQPHANGQQQTRKVSVIEMLSPALNRYQPKRKNSINLNVALSMDVNEDVTSLDNIDPIRFISILLQCLNLLDKTEDAIETIKARTEGELMNVVKRTVSRMLERMKEKSSTRLTKHLDNWSYELNLNIPCVLRCNAILSNPNHSAYLLNDLCHLLFDQFRTVAQMHEQMLIPMFKRIENLNQESSKLSQINYKIYNMTEIWNKIQQVLNIVTDMYLDVNGTNSQNQMSNPSKMINSDLMNLDGTLNGMGKNFDLNSFFVKKRVGLSAAVQAGNQLISSNKQNFLNNIQNMSYGQSSQNKKSSLFRFDCSSHSISLNSYLSEQKQQLQQQHLDHKKDNSLTGQQKNSFDSDESGSNVISIYDDQQTKNQDYMLCQPTCENILILYIPLMKFVSEIDEKMNQDANAHCVLYSQLKNFANSFIKIQLNSDLERVLDYSIKCLSNFTILNNTQQLKKLNRDKPLLLSTVIIIQCINDMRQLMHKLPLNCEDILLMINELLNDYKENCLTIYKMIVEKEEEKKIISANWVKDEDINRCLKSLPNWVNLSKYYNTNGQLYLSSASQSRMSNLSFDKQDESPEDVHLRNKRETELLISNITQDSLITSNEVLNEVEQLKNLAQLQEAMEYLGFECIKLADNLPRKQSIKNNLQLNEFASAYIQDERQITIFKKLGKEFIDLSECTLLVLHLEIRVHCFYHLLRIFQQNSFSLNTDNLDIDQEVLEFNKDLALIDEQLNIYLQNYKLCYMFEGVSHLVSTILINNVASLKKINENGVKRMCKNIFSIQQQLTGITLNREVALDYCRQYYELFSNNKNPEELLSSIMEKGIQFTEIEYVNAINLIHRSLNRETILVDSILKRLKDILKK